MDTNTSGDKKDSKEGNDTLMIADQHVPKNDKANNYKPSNKGTNYKLL